MATSTAELAEIADSGAPLSERAPELLDRLRHLLPFDAAWLAVADPDGPGWSCVASTGLDDRVLEHLAGPVFAHDVELTHTGPADVPLSPSDLPYPATELPTWAECFLPAGFHEALGVSLAHGARRRVGHLALLSVPGRPPSPEVRQRLRRLAPVLARGADPLRTVAASARLVRGATAAAVLHRRGGVRPLPGLDGDELLAADSPVVAVARSRIEEGQVCASFLWPRGGPHALEGHVRVTVLTCPDGAAVGVVGTVVLSPPGQLHGLTPRELVVLGLVVDGCTNQEIARSLVLSPRTVATHLEHVLVKLDATTRTLAAVRAEREGLLVPSSPSTCGT